MSLTLEPSNLVDAGSGLALILLGLAVLRVRPRRRATLAFAVFSVAFGYNFLPSNLVSSDDPFVGLVLLGNVASKALFTVAMVAVALWFPTPLRPAERRIARAAAAVTLGYVAVSAAIVLATWPTMVQPDEAASAHPDLLLLEVLDTDVLLTAMLSAFAFALLLLALRFHAAASGRERRQLALMGAALVLYPAVFAGSEVFSESTLGRLFAVVDVSLVALMTALWLRNARDASGADARVARDVALAGLASMLLGMVGSALWEGGGYFGLARLAAAGLLAYAILRHQLLGLDVRVKWTLQQSTVAAAFVGVFFVVSESASTFFASSIGPYVGIAAAGALVFALVPLQRFAERVASAAMPGVKPLGELSAAERAAVYRDAAVLAWADGSLSRDERTLLDGLQRSLGIGQAEAMRLEQQAAQAGKG